MRPPLTPATRIRPKAPDPQLPRPRALRGFISFNGTEGLRVFKEDKARYERECPDRVYEREVRKLAIFDQEGRKVV
jgi:hypothetical protein